MPDKTKCCSTGEIQCYMQGAEERQVEGFVCCGSFGWYDTITGSLINVQPVSPCQPPPVGRIFCNGADNITQTTAHLSGEGDLVAPFESMRICYGTTPGGPYPNCGPQVAGTSVNNQPFDFNVVGLTADTSYYYVAQILDTFDNVIETSDECAFSTPPAVPPVQDTIVFNFPDGQPANQAVLDCFEAARATLNACFITQPVLFNGDQQIHIDLRVNNDPPFDGVPGGVTGFAGPTAFRPDGTTYSGTMEFEEATMADLDAQDCNIVALHEMLHALGFGTSNNWTNQTVNPNTNLWGFTGPQALAEYQAMAGGFPGAVAIPIEWDTGSPGSDGGHWDEGPGGAGPGAPNGYNQNCFVNELMSYFVSGTGTFSRVTAAALRDLGYDFNVGCGTAFGCGGA